MTIYVVNFSKELKEHFNAYNIIKINVKSKVVLITAHPDDECMFFSPTLLNLISHCNVFIICVTTGDYYKKGAVRKREFFDSCRLLGISKDNIEILEDSSFPDDPKTPWDYEQLTRALQEILSRIQANYIFTFDNRGVSGHANHIAVSTVVRKISINQTSLKVYQLDTVPAFRKYIGLLDLPFTVLSRKITFISSPRNILRSQQAMFAHKSQLEWFRLLNQQNNLVFFFPCLISLFGNNTESKILFSYLQVLNCFLTENFFVKIISFFKQCGPREK
ncbi:hypothetical protein Btru_064129 [Bulinus truncatus]|nr:hypothetical protein Btru_064129 [Bulinus truncatus]